MKKKLPKDWMPPENVLNLARAKGMPIEDWLYHLLPEWRLYWIDSGLTKDSWGSTFWNWAKKQWLLVDKRRMYQDIADALPTVDKELDKYVDQLVENEYLKHEVKPMSSAKRIEFADYLSRSMNNE